MTVASVALDLKLDRLFDYSVPEELKNSVDVGSFVEIPLRSSLRQGTVISLKAAENDRELKPISRVLQEKPLIQKDLLQLALWMSDYYCTSLSDVLKCMVPAAAKGKVQAKEQYFVTRAKTREQLAQETALLRRRAPQQAEVLDKMLLVEKGMLLTKLLEESKSSRQTINALADKGLLAIEKVILERSPLEGADFLPSKPKTLTGEQKQVFDETSSDLQSNRFCVHLLHGVTGSGKTEVYLQLISQALSLGKSAIVMVPEIALTSQTIERFRSRFEGQIAVMHHRLSEGEKRDEWIRIQKGEAKIVVGARSAVFSPMPNLGLIIVDEEHEASYKQSDGMPAYHARDVAVMRGKLNKALVILGSATPSLESAQNCKLGKYRLSTLTKRPENALLPDVRVIDMRIEYEKKKQITLFSDELLNGIEKRLSKGEQSILFLNRRGYHTSLVCPSCGERIKCPSCSITLSFHKSEKSLACHLCDFRQPPPTLCPSCKACEPLKYKGIGTEQVESALYAIFPDVRVLRLDADTTRHQGSHQKLYKSFRTGKADVLIGTQMIAKGLHFPEVTLVGILNADMGLQIPDFRAGETTFQLLTQVAGRAGRGVQKGEVLIQTSVPENSIIGHASRQDFNSFLEEELEVRKFFHYPPFTQMVKLRFTGSDLKIVESAANEYRYALEKEGLSATPVTPCGHAKIKEQHRMHLFVKGEKITPLLHAIQRVRQKTSLPRSIKLFIDVNPLSTFF